MTDVLICPGCGAEHRPGARFCDECGARLSALAAQTEERKVVTTLFCDLVAFTAMSEAADPEDVDRLLRDYFARAAKAIESHGGTVEKFIGDAVVGVFGVPAVHEDDPERAVRTALRLLEALEGLTRPDGTPLQARCGVNTGEALVRLDVAPGSGRGFLTGDAVNTAARLEAAAPPGGIAVGALTRELTQRVIVYEKLPPVHAKGKAEPVHAWLAVAPVARRGLDTDAADLTPFVGREVELAYLTALFQKTVSQEAPQFILLAGESGIGKSRLVRQLLQYVDAQPRLTTWRQGYCPSFGEDVTYWALAEIVKGHAGIQDTDETAAIEAKLDAVLPGGPDREWFRQRLRALLGLSAAEGSREENFTAWLRFFEEMAAARPTVIVFEDLHWADEALLAFVEHLASHLAAVPLMVVGTARPELYERRSGFASDGRINRVGLEPLSRQETSRLVSELLGASAPAGAVVERVVQTCEGNPFYAEQSARLISDAPAAVALPESVQAVIAARLDALPPEQKAACADAAVVGVVFWDGALLALGDRERADLDAALNGLLERRLIRRVRESSMEGEREYAFVHALARDVAYGQLPRTSKARRHAAAAEWIESRLSTESGDFAEVLGYHYSTALALAQTAGEDGLAAELLEPALRCLIQSGRRALKLDPRPAEGIFRKALELAPPDHPLRPLILSKLAQCCGLALRWDEAEALLTEAIPGLEAHGDVRGHMDALMGMRNLAMNQGREPATPIEEIVARLEAEGPSEELVEALTSLAGMHYMGFTGDRDRFFAICDQAIAVAAEVGVPALSAKSFRASRRLELEGDLSALEEYEQTVAESRARGLGEGTAFLLFNRACMILAVSGAKAQLEAYENGLEFAVGLGSTWYREAFCMGIAEALAVNGRWDESLAAFAKLLPRLEAGNDTLDLYESTGALGVVLARRGDLQAASEIQAWLDAHDPGHYPVYQLAQALIGKALERALKGETGEAIDALAQWLIGPSPTREPAAIALVPDAVRTALACGDAPLAQSIRDVVAPVLPLNEHVAVSCAAALAEAAGDLEAAAAGFADAARRWHDFGVPYEEGHALLGQGRCLVALGRAPEAAAPVTAARAIFAALGARPALDETDGLLVTVGLSVSGAGPA